MIMCELNSVIMFQYVQNGAQLQVNYLERLILKLTAFQIKNYTYFVQNYVKHKSVVCNE